MPAGVSLSALIPHFSEGLRSLRRFVYKGSLPTPPCYESVTWVVFNRPVVLTGQTVRYPVFSFNQNTGPKMSSFHMDYLCMIGHT